MNQAVIINKVPILGICLGMQLMGKTSDEGELNGLAWVDLNVKSFETIKTYKGTIPLMGWNYVTIAKENKILKMILRDFILFTNIILNEMNTK